MYDAQADKDQDLRAVLAYLSNQSNRAMDANATPEQEAKELARGKAYDDAATRLLAVLDTPVAQEAPGPVQPEPGTRLTFAPDEMTVVVVAPAGVLGRGMPTVLYLGPNDALETSTLSPFTKLVVGAMLDQAREQLDG